MAVLCRRASASSWPRLRRRASRGAPGLHQCQRCQRGRAGWGIERPWSLMRRPRSMRITCIWCPRKRACQMTCIAHTHATCFAFMAHGGDMYMPLHMYCIGRYIAFSPCFRARLVCAEAGCLFAQWSLGAVPPCHAPETASTSYQKMAWDTCPCLLCRCVF